MFSTTPRHLCLGKPGVLLTRKLFTPISPECRRSTEYITLLLFLLYGSLVCQACVFNLLCRVCLTENPPVLLAVIPQRSPLPRGSLLHRAGRTTMHFCSDSHLCIFPLDPSSAIADPCMLLFLSPFLLPSKYLFSFTEISVSAPTLPVARNPHSCARGQDTMPLL